VIINRRFAATLFFSLAAAAAHSGEASIHLKGGEQAVLVQLRCSTCHSLDYIVMNSPFLSRAPWDAEVRKMIKIMGAPIPDNEVASIVDYLTQYYGAN